MLNKMLWEITTKYIRENYPIKINPPCKRVISDKSSCYKIRINQNSFMKRKQTI